MYTIKCKVGYYHGNSNILMLNNYFILNIPCQKKKSFRTFQKIFYLLYKILFIEFFFENFNIFENDMISVDVIMTIGCKHGKVNPKIKIKIYLKFNNKIIISKYTLKKDLKFM